MESRESPSRCSLLESSRRLSLVRQREQSPSYSSQHVAKKMRRLMPSKNPDEPLPSIEIESYSERDITFEEDTPDRGLHSTPIFIDEGVLVGFWFADASGIGRRPVFA